MKYINAEKLIDEIQQLQKTNKSEAAHISEYVQGGIYGFNIATEKIIEIISRLQQEFEINEFSFKGGTATINGIEHNFKPGKAKVIILDITENED